MKFAICNEIFQNWTLEDAMNFAKKCGYDAIEIAPFTLAKDVNTISPAERERIRILAASIGLEISGIHWVLVQTEGLHLTARDRVIRDQTSEYFCDLVHFCADIGGKFMVVGSPKQRNIPEGVAKEEAWTWATEVFRAPVRCAEQRGVTICFEPLAPAETNFVNTAEEAIQFTKQFASPHFRIILDVKAMCSETKSIPAIIQQSAPHLSYFHANDENLKGPGFGRVDFKPIAAALKQIGYEGFVSVEVFKFEEGPEVIATQSIDYLKRCFA